MPFLPNKPATKDDLPYNFGIGSHYKKHTFTVKDLANCLDRSEGTIRNDMCKKIVDLDDFKSVVRYMLKHGDFV